MWVDYYITFSVADVFHLHTFLLQVQMADDVQSLHSLNSFDYPFIVDPEDIPLEKVQVKSSGHVLSYVGVACLGAILFGYHLGYVLHCYYKMLVS
jgi:hypothetical protein